MAPRKKGPKKKGPKRMTTTKKPAAAKEQGPAFRAVRDRTLSLWQSAAEEVAARSAAPKAAAAGVVMAPRIAAADDAPALDLEAARALDRPAAATALAVALAGEEPAAKAVAPSLTAAVGGTIVECNKLALQLAWAKARGDAQAVQQLQDSLNFSNCDPGWRETVEQFLLYFKWQHASIPYRSGGDYVLDYELPANATIAIIGDWGTGTPTALALLDQVAQHNPQVIFHLGDIYYSGTPDECQARFLAPCQGLRDNGARVYTLSGNHDMYSGGVGYYWLVDKLEQQASYFCVHNEHWQFLAMDTGYSDYDPLPWLHSPSFPLDVSTPPSLTDVEGAWHADKIRQAGDRKTVLLSHHPAFTAYDPIAGQSTNTQLLKPFQGLLQDVALWFWGHEHRLAIYGSYADIERGRCVGCSAIPVFVREDPYKVKYEDVPVLPPMLGNNGDVYNRGYAIMQLDGPKATVSYYQDSDGGNALYVEELG